jgi:hypothetical protein
MEEGTASSHLVDEGLNPDPLARMLKRDLFAGEVTRVFFDDLARIDRPF